jgi:hypothetical protein
MQVKVFDCPVHACFCISTKVRNSLGAKVKQALTEVKMSIIRKRSAEADKKKTYRVADRVTVLCLVCEKMAERVVRARQEEEDRRVRQEVRYKVLYY